MKNIKLHAQMGTCLRYWVGSGLKISTAKSEFLELGFGNWTGNHGSSSGVELGDQILNGFDKFKYLSSDVR